MFSRTLASHVIVAALAAVCLNASSRADSGVALLNATAANYASSASFSVQLATDTPANYQWFKDGTPIPTAQTPTLSIPFVRVADAGAYHVVVSNEAGTAVSRAAGLSVITQPELISGLPADQVVVPGANVSLRASASGKNLTYQWYFKGSLLRGKNSATLSLSNVGNAQAGTYVVKISNKAGPIATSVAIIRVEPTSGI